jgi:hypothetical protein
MRNIIKMLNNILEQRYDQTMWHFPHPSIFYRLKLFLFVCHSRSYIAIEITDNSWSIDPTSRWGGYVFDSRGPRGPCKPRLRGRHKSPGIAANNMRAKFISPVDSYVTALLCVRFSAILRGWEEGREKRWEGGIPRETAFAWKYAGWLSTLENLSAIDYTPRGKQYVRDGSRSLASGRYGRYSCEYGATPGRFFRRWIERATPIFAYIII